MVDKRYRVLVVDDETSIRNICKRALTKLADVDTAESAEVAAECVAKTKYDAVILDVMLPGKQGDEFLKELRSNYPEISVIMITGKPDVNVAVETLKNGAFDYIIKPFEIGELRSVVEKAVNKGNIMIIDDDEGVVKSITKIVIRDFPSIKIVIEENPSAVLNRLSNEKMDLIFLDVRLEGADGLDIAEKAINEYGYDPAHIVVMTGFTTDEVKERVEKLGIAFYLEKPFFIDDIIKIIRDNIEGDMVWK